MNEQLPVVKINQLSTGNNVTNWSNLYKTGGIAALVSLIFFPIQIGVLLVSPPPDTVIGWFNLFNRSPLIGLIDLDLLLVVDQILVILIFLALYVVLRQTSKSLLLIGLTLGLVSSVLFIASNPAFAMLSLSNQYFSAVDETIRTMTLSAGQAVITTWSGSAFHASYILGSVAAILVSLAMLISNLFSRAAGYMGIVSNGIAFGLYVPIIGVYISIFSVVFLWVWYLFVARDLIKLAKTAQGNEQ